MLLLGSSPMQIDAFAAQTQLCMLVMFVSYGMHHGSTSATCVLENLPDLNRNCI